MTEDLQNRRATDPVLDEIRRNQIEILSLLKGLSRAFPENKFGEPDLSGHRTYHDELIVKDKEFSEVRQEAVKKVVSTGIAGLAMITIYALWDYIKAHLK